MKRHSHNGFSLTELLIAMIAGAILLLSVGVLSGRSLEVQKKTQQRAEIYNDLTIVLRMMEKHIRESFSANIVTGGQGWVGDRIVIKAERLDSPEMAFGLHSSANSVNLVYVPDITNMNEREVLFSVPSPGTISLTLDETSDTTQYTIEITIQGIKRNIPFTVSTQARRRRETT